MPNTYDTHKTTPTILGDHKNKHLFLNVNPINYKLTVEKGILHVFMKNREETCIFSENLLQ